VSASCRRLYQARIGLPAAAAGIAVDMLYDHLLAARWPHDVVADAASPLPLFAADFYRLTSSDAASPLPATARQVLDRMAAEDWLTSYQDLGSIRLALERIRQRLSPRAAAACPLARAADVFAAQHDAFAADFEAFWPELAAHSRQYLLNQCAMANRPA
jgi:acyl carrier protein phosphodiesterase